MSRKQKLIYSLIGLVVLLVVLFVVSKLVAWREQAIGDITTQTNEAGTITIGVMNPSLITDMSWTYEGETYSMEYRSGVWDKVTDVAFPVNQTVLSDMTSAISSLTANQGIPNVSDMEPYGLVVPSMTIKIKADNERLTYKIGDKNELTGEYYLQLNTLSTVYLVDADIVETFSKGLFEIMQVETVPEYGTTASATIENANVPFRFCTKRPMTVSVGIWTMKIRRFWTPVPLPNWSTMGSVSAGWTVIPIRPQNTIWNPVV